jgi:hypothetical protein
MTSEEILELTYMSNLNFYAMKKIFTILKLSFIALALVGTGKVSAQIVDLDPGFYYMIQPSRNTSGVHVALGIDVAEKNNDEALLQKQTQDGMSASQLWQIIPVTDSTYRFKNMNSGMALGRTTWRGKRPDITGDPTNVWHFDAWSGHPPHFGVCQRIWNEEDPSQVWQPIQYVYANDTPRYKMVNADHLHDSTWSFNLWRNDPLLHTDADAYQNKNIALADGQLEESDKYKDATLGYSYFFTITFIEVPASALNENLTENIHVYSVSGSIRLKGELYGKRVEVYSILGSRINSSLASSSEMNIDVKPGLYVVKAGKMVTKLVVK